MICFIMRISIQGVINQLKNPKGVLGAVAEGRTTYKSYHITEYRVCPSCGEAVPTEHDLRVKNIINHLRQWTLQGRLNRHNR